MMNGMSLHPYPKGASIGRQISMHQHKSQKHKTKQAKRGVDAVGELHSQDAGAELLGACELMAGFFKSLVASLNFFTCNLATMSAAQLI